MNNKNWVNGKIKINFNSRQKSKKKDYYPWIVTTQNSSIGIRGTVIALSYDTTEMKTEIVLLSGKEIVLEIELSESLLFISFKR